VSVFDLLWRLKGEIFEADPRPRRHERDVAPPRPPRLITMAVVQRPCRECGEPLDMSDGAVLAQYEDGSLGCRKHAEGG